MNMNIVPGQAPGNNQINLGAMTGNLKGVLGAGSLGNTVQNPMAGINDILGQSAMGYQNAMANSRMQDIILQAKMQALQQKEKQYEMDQQKPGLTDILGLGLSGYGAIQGADQKNALAKFLQGGGQVGNQDWTQYGDYAGWMG